MSNPPDGRRPSAPVEDCGADGRVSPQVEDVSQAGTPEGRRVLGLLWNPPTPSTRGPRQKVTVAQVVAAAIELADADGFEALSMRELARRVGVGTMSLYTYVPGKSELFELMIDRAYSERQLPSPDLPWRERFEAHAAEALAMYRRHPWLVHSNLWRLPLSPGVLDVTEDMLTVGVAAGLTPDHVTRVQQVLEAHVFGIARGELVDQNQAIRSTESFDDYWAARASFWETYFDTARYPTMLAMWEAQAYEASNDPAAGLSFGLGLILDSVERLVAGR